MTSSESHPALRLVGERRNGNYTVQLFEDGTRIRESEEDILRPESPDSIDLKITNYCDLAKLCVYCHEDSDRAGQHAPRSYLKELLDSLPGGTEIAIGGGNPLSHPELLEFLVDCKAAGLVPNLTVNQLHTSSHLLKEIIDRKLIYGLGVSWRNPSVHVPDYVKSFPGAVLHIIAGVESPGSLPEDWERVLVLGYKRMRKGDQWFGPHVEKSLKKWFNQLPLIVGRYPAVAFDNLAVQQLKVRRLFCREEDYMRFFQGAEGTHSFYIDAVEKQWAISSSSTERFPVNSSLVEIFQNNVSQQYHLQ